MSIRRWVVVSALCVAVFMVAAPAKAQGVEASVGYNYLYIDTEPGDPDDLQNLPAGWYADVAANLTSMFGVVGQVTGNYKSIDFGSGDEADLKIHTFMGGVRIGGSALSIRPFVQVLFGGANAKFTGDFDDSETDAALQAGAGVNIKPGPIGLRLGADYIRVFTEDEGTNVFRVGVGIVFGN
jgi:Outer membrane protein beta-barrel domain